MRACILLIAMGVSSMAQEAPVVSAGVPLRVALEQRVRIRHAGDAIEGKLVEPVFVFDRMVVPAGSVVEGHIAHIGGVPKMRRVRAILSGNFTPPRDVQAQFDTLVLPGGSRLPLNTALSRGTAHTMRVNKPQKGTSNAVVQNERDRFDTERAAFLAFKEPGKLSRLKSALTGMLPYHRQAWTAGTLFSSVLAQPLAGLPPVPAFAGIEFPAPGASDAPEVNARLITPVSSATAKRGATVEAVVTRPLFAADHSLLIPEGTRLTGDIVEVKPARFLHRNGRVLFVFRQIQNPERAARGIQGYVEGVQADFNAHLALDSEGAARAVSPKTRFIFPAIAVAVAGLSFHQDYNAQGVPDYDIGGRAESGAVGLGLVGTLLAQIGPRAVASTIAISGAAFSVYSTFIARGANVVLPLNTPVKVSLKSRVAK